jgi:glutamate/tyrosine decarboxylase-like PLP-dependent enzyme
VQVHLPVSSISSLKESMHIDYSAPQNDSISTALEYRTLEMILDLLSVSRESFKGRSLTTGATASNILGVGMLAHSFAQYFSFFTI